jgi:hypothetical protein
MGCSGSKDKTKDAGDAPAAPVEKKAAATEEKKAEPKKDEKPKEDMNAKSAETMSADLRNMMQDYFNRYDLDGSCTINTKEELKQLCTNLVVKLDLELDVQEIDKLVEDAGDMSKNNWTFDEKNQAGQCFAYWFLDKFGEKHPGLAQWHFDDLSSEEDDVDPNAKHGGFYRQGTYEGELVSGDKKYCKRGSVAGKSKEGINVFVVKVRYQKTEKDDDKPPGVFVDRSGCDGMGYFRTSGKADEKGTFEYTQDYDIDNNRETLEPKLVLTGEADTEAGPGCIKGTWVNGNASDDKAQAMMKDLGLEGCTEGTFTLRKKQHDE